jgi:hypothetical protein
MNEGFPQHNKPKGPWAVEPGSPLDMLEQRQRLERQALASIMTSLRSFAREQGFTYEVEDEAEGNNITVEPETLTQTLGHLQPLLREVNNQLRERQVSTQVRVAIHGMQIQLHLKR